MRKFVILVIGFGLSFVSCETTNINDETAIEIDDIYATDKEDSTNTGGSPLNPSNDDD
ncbi:hypothetical protein [Aquimarina aggregata]|uniref:hypothetical protein n=1 Tax=Aquimarina aggregata TaxID=1642818 RepID=UPI002491A74F|nr:hypothetical protein [Aquimarina aggregata]